ncbi:hypothetical protein [Streptomyces sp. NBC_01803]|uniref:hypothetical protein n=1 Tax=Streptomyces sp. NBC_01803 TaxID=2975946 RepID=UPI002DDC0C60|nr:hypothetical protein [Streptomyces sp. NBC_01803]WSA46919.1 hypothetical protein OIE51_23720 [Streptomyces sp. NBC_01803]
MSFSVFGRRSAVAVAITAACALAVPAVEAAQAAPAPERVRTAAFLSPAQMPPHETGWVADAPAAGLPEWPVPCVAEELPAEGAWYRLYRTEYDTNGLQVIVETGDEDEAAELTAALGEAAADCAADWLRVNPGATAAWDDYGRVTARGTDGAHLYGVHTAPPESGKDVRLFGIGRDGTRVVVVEWAQLGDLTDAPVADFRTTTRGALGRLGR